MDNPPHGILSSMYDLWEVHILPRLSIHEVLAVRGTSRQLRDIVDNSKIWKRLYQEEFGVWLNCELSEALGTFFQRTNAQLIRVGTSKGHFAAIQYFPSQQEQEESARRSKRGFGRLGKWAGQKAKTKNMSPFPDVYVKSMALNVDVCVALSFGGSIHVTTTQTGNDKYHHQIKCPSGGRFTKIGTAVASLGAIDENGVLYIYSRGPSGRLELKMTFKDPTFYAAKSCRWATKLVCSTSEGLVAIETENEPLVVTQPCFGNVIDFVVLCREPLRVVYATAEELHFVELSLNPVNPPKKLGTISQLTGSKAPIVRLETTRDVPDVWAINTEGTCFEATFDFGKENPLVSFVPFRLPGKVCDLSIGETLDERYAHTVDGRVHTFEGSIVDRVPTYKIDSRFETAFGVCNLPR